MKEEKYRFSFRVPSASLAHNYYVFNALQDDEERRLWRRYGECELSEWMATAPFNWVSRCSHRKTKLDLHNYIAGVNGAAQFFNYRFSGLGERWGARILENLGWMRRLLYTRCIRVPNINYITRQMCKIFIINARESDQRNCSRWYRIISIFLFFPTATNTLNHMRTCVVCACISYRIIFRIYHISRKPRVRRSHVVLSGSQNFIQWRYWCGKLIRLQNAVSYLRHCWPSSCVVGRCCFRWAISPVSFSIAPAPYTYRFSTCKTSDVRARRGCTHHWCDQKAENKS